MTDPPERTGSMALPMTRPAPPCLLLVNDDGINADGLALLEQQARQITDDVWVVAPQDENSGGGHSVSLASPIRARQLDEKRFAVNGTPTDCVLLAVWDLMRHSRPTMVLTGINHGENLADDMTYSGTMGAAMEAAVLGIPAIALSQIRQLGQPIDFTTAREHGPEVLRRLLPCQWEPGIVVNVNYPRPSQPGARRLRVTELGRRLPGTFRPVEGRDGRKLPYYWVQVSYNTGIPASGTDLEAAQQGDVSITAITMDMTARSFNSQLKSTLGA
jgi:5'-nucleotidase